MHLRGAVSGRCATIPENRRAPYREVVRGSRCRLAGVDASMGQRLLGLPGSLQTLATVARIWIEIVACSPRLTWRPTAEKLWHDGSAMRIHETAQNLTRKILNNATAEARSGTRLEPGSVRFRV